MLCAHTYPWDSFSLLLSVTREWETDNHAENGQEVVQIVEHSGVDSSNIGGIAGAGMKDLFRTRQGDELGVRGKGSGTYQGL